MSLTMVATPIGNSGDITLRAIETLRSAEVVIGEEFREVTTLLKRLDIARPSELRVLNEHSKADELKELVELCRQRRVVLVSDCGTPGFCDPGANLVAACRAEGIEVSGAPGVSSLMALLMISGLRLDRFVFRGFLPAERGARGQALQELKQERQAVVLMDTPYRLEKLLSELAELLPNREAVLGVNLTGPDEKVERAKLQELARRYAGQKAEFLLILLA